MVKKTISELNDGSTTILPANVGVFDQAGLTSNIRLAPASSRVIYASNQAQLESEFGTNIDIPDSEGWDIVVVEGFELAKPIHLGSASALRIRQSAIGSGIAYTASGLGPMIQNTNPLTPALGFNINGGGFVNTVAGNNFIDLTVLAGGFVTLGSLRLENFSGFGTIEGGQHTLDIIQLVETSTIAIEVGIISVKASSLSVSNLTMNNINSPTDIPLLTIVSDGSNVDVTIDNLRAPNLSSNGELVFFDPNTSVISSYIIENSTIPEGIDFYQQGADIAIDDVASGGAGLLEYITDGTAHNLKIGQATVTSTFLDSNYNGTKIVVDTPAPDRYVTEGTFTATGSGITNKSSLDQTDLLVTAKGNPGQRNSMSTGDAFVESTGDPIRVVIDTAGVPKPIDDTVGTPTPSGSWATANLERFEEDTGTPNQGRIIVKDRGTKRYLVTYSGTVDKVSGGGVNIGIDLLINGVASGINPPRTVTTIVTPLTRTEIIELSEDDVVQVGAVNYNNNDDIDVFQSNLTIILPE